MRHSHITRRLEFLMIAATAAACIVGDERTETELPGLPPDEDPAESLAQLGAIAPGRLELLQHRVGFAGATVGGAAGDIVTVTSLADSGPGTLREAVAGKNPAWIVFGVSGTIALQSSIQLTSNKTIDGRGKSIVIRNHGLFIADVENVIVHDITIADGAATATDAITIARANKIWIDHCTLRNFPDGLIDITRATPTKQRVSLTWNRFEDHDKVMAIGLQDVYAPDDDLIFVTLAHNYFRATTQRHPRLAQATAHVFNTVFEHWGSYAVASGQDARLLLEANHFVAQLSPTVSRTDLDVTAAGASWPGAIRGVNNRLYGGVTTIGERNPQRVSTPSYSYNVWQTTDCNRAQIRERSGAHSTPVWPAPC